MIFTCFLNHSTCCYDLYHGLASLGLLQESNVCIAEWLGALLMQTLRPCHCLRVKQSRAESSRVKQRAQWNIMKSSRSTVQAVSPFPYLSLNSLNIQRTKEPKQNGWAASALDRVCTGVKIHDMQRITKLHFSPKHVSLNIPFHTFRRSVAHFAVKLLSTQRMTNWKEPAKAASGTKICLLDVVCQKTLRHCQANEGINLKIAISSWSFCALGSSLHC